MPDYQRYEVTYAIPGKKGRHVWGWTDDRRQAERMVRDITRYNTLTDPLVRDRKGEKLDA